MFTPFSGSLHGEIPEIPSCDDSFCLSAPSLPPSRHPSAYSHGIDFTSRFHSLPATPAAPKSWLCARHVTGA